jgi:predicted RNA-binding protein YlxR (DUF448 family)
MSRGGKKKDQAAGPERKCIATGEVLPTPALIRFCVGPEEQIFPDVAGRLPGRGIWVRADRTALKRAVQKNLFPRAAKSNVRVPADLVQTVEGLLLDRTISLLAMARKAGQAVAGFEKVKGWLATGEGTVLIQSSDGSARGKAKLKPPDGEGTFIGCLTGAEIGLAFGRDSVVHGALSAGGLATRVVEEAKRLSGVRNGDGSEAVEKDTKNV